MNETYLSKLNNHDTAGPIAASLLKWHPEAAAIFEEWVQSDPRTEGYTADFLRMYDAIVLCLDNGGTFFVGGNGGSHSDALHITGELLKSFERDRRLNEKERARFAGLPFAEEVSSQLENAFRAIPLGVNTVLSTAVENDFSIPAMAFAQEVFAQGRPGDVLLGISTSGNAQNLLYAMTAAKSIGMTTLVLTGASGGKMAQVGDIAVKVPSTVTARIQEFHLPTYHALCAMIEARNFLPVGSDAVPPKGSILADGELRDVVRALKRTGKRVVWTNGCFDILHFGHVSYLNRARECGDVLVVGLNSDASIRAIKGAGRPISPQNERGEILANLKAVDYVTVFDDPNTVRLLELLEPDVYAKGGDYTLDTIVGEERRVVESYGGEIAILPGIEALSTTRILERIRKDA